MKINIYNFNYTITEELKTILDRYNFEEGKQIISYIYNDVEDAVKSDCDYCIIPLKYADKFKHKKVIYINDNDNITIKLLAKNPANFFFNLPLRPEEIRMVLDLVTTEAQAAITAKVPGGGKVEIPIKDLNYINIVVRNLEYGLTKEKIRGLSLRGSFLSATQQYLDSHPQLLLATNTLILNTINIKTIFSDHVVFKNNEVIYFPKTVGEKLKRLRGN